MKFRPAMRWLIAVVISLAVTSFAETGKDDKKDKPKSSPVETVDSGSFGVFISGQRVVTETFSIEQRNGSIVIKSQLKETGGSAAASQKSDMELSPKSELMRYEWNQDSGASLTVLPDNEFLKERITAANGAKPAEQAFLLPSVTPILDNNFFVHREVLIWKYLAIAPCKDENGRRRCDPADFGALVPQDRTSMSVRMSLFGKEKVTIRGAAHELLRLDLHGDQFDWNLWVDESDHFKLMKVAIPADNTEVVRD